MKFLKTIALLLLCSTGFSQGNNDTVTTDATGNRDVESAHRLGSSPKVIDTIKPVVVVDYPLLQLKFETNSSVDQINPAVIDTKTSLSKLYNSYVKLGIGSTVMPLGEVYYNSSRSRKSFYGVHVKHLSSFGKLKGYAPAQFDNTKANAFYGLRNKKYDLTADIHYQNNGFNYYGISDTLGLTRDSISQRFSNVGFDFTYRAHKKDSAQLNYAIGLKYNNFLSKKPLNGEKKWRVNENFAALNTTGYYKHKNEVYALDFNVNLNDYRYGLKDSINPMGIDSGIVRTNTVIELKPTITTQLANNKFRAKVGVDLVLDVNHKTTFHIYPIAELKYSFLNDMFIPYVGVKGGLQQNSFKSLANTNPYIITNVNMVNEKTPIAFYGGFKGTLTKNISFHAGVNFTNVRDKVLFVQDTTYSRGNQFGIITDTMNVVSIEASISYQLLEKFKVDAIGRFNSYSTFNNSYAWQLPRMEFIVRGSYNLFNKFIFNVDVKLEEGRKALLYAPTHNSTIENGQHIENLGFIADANLSVEYRYNKRISAFLQGNNLASQKYLRWQNYQVQPIQVLGGVTFRF